MGLIVQKHVTIGQLIFDKKEVAYLPSWPTYPTFPVPTLRGGQGGRAPPNGFLCPPFWFTLNIVFGT